MKIDEFIKKHKIKKIYSYHEEKQDKVSVKFGWIPARSLDLNKSVVVSTTSKSKRTLDSDKEWSTTEGNSAASLEDYKRYFQALTGDSADNFIKKWTAKEEELEEYRKQENKGYRDNEGEFLLDLARLISNRKKFAKFGRVYKIVDIKT